MRPLFLAVIAAVAFVACAHALTPTKPEPALAPVGAEMLPVRFLGTAPGASELFVCGWFTADAGTSLDCVDYEYFMKRLQEQQP